MKDIVPDINNSLQCLALHSNIDALEIHNCKSHVETADRLPKIFFKDCEN